MSKEINALAIIPAKTDSKRLKKKNLRVIAGKTLVEHAIDYVKNSKYIKCVIVTTESEEVCELVEKYDEIVIFDEEMNLLRYSNEIKLSKTNIEFSLGLIVEDDRVLVTYSQLDKTSELVIYDKKYIDNICKNIY